MNFTKRILIIAFLNFSSLAANAQSVLRYGLSEWVNRPTPAIQVHMDSLYAADIYDNTSYDARISALQQIATGGEPAKMEAFRKAAAPDAIPHLYYGCPVIKNPLIEVQTYQKPYMVKQGDYQGWINAFGSNVNLVSERALLTNNFRGNLSCPLNISTSSLKKTLGYSIKPLGSATQSDSVEMLIDNSINPWRWTAPINITHHVEQPSMALFIRAPNATVARTTGQYLTDFANGIPKIKRLYLDYTVDISVEDLSVSMGEFTVDDFLRNTMGTDLISKIKEITFGSLIPFSNEWRAYYDKRLRERSLQVTMMINLREDGIGWMSQEFMLASLNYKKDTTFPLSPNVAMNNYIYEGGNNNIGASWYRLNVNALTEVPGIIPNGKNQIYKGGNGYWEIPPYQNISNTMWGSIDLTEFVKVAKGHQFLPGHLATPSDPTQKVWDKMSLNWAGVAFEAHGALKTKVKVRTFNISYR